MKEPTNYTDASVKVMRSYDYCHFEVSLSLSDRVLTPELVDNMRKDAARLADKAVEQYKIAKAASERVGRIKLSRELKYAEETPEGERTPQQKAIIKYHSDKEFAARFDYDYEDDWESSPDLE